MSDTNIGNNGGGAAAYDSQFNLPQLDPGSSGGASAPVGKHGHGAPAGKPGEGVSEAGGKPQTEKAAGTGTTSGSFDQSTIETADQSEITQNSATVDPTNPKLSTPNTILTSTPGDKSGGNINKFLGCIYNVALEEVVAKQTKADTQLEKTLSEGYLNNMKEAKDQTDEKAQEQRDIGEVGAFTSFAKAFSCGVDVAISAGTGVGGMFKGPKTSTGAAIAQTGQALRSIGGSDSIFSNIAQGVGEYEKSNMEANVTELDFGIKMTEDTASRLDSERKEVSDSKDQLLQQYIQWENAQFAFTQRG